MCWLLFEGTFFSWRHVTPPFASGRQSRHQKHCCYVKMGWCTVPRSSVRGKRIDEPEVTHCLKVWSTWMFSGCLVSARGPRTERRLQERNVIAEENQHWYWSELVGNDTRKVYWDDEHVWMTKEQPKLPCNEMEHDLRVTKKRLSSKDWLKSWLWLLQPMLKRWKYCIWSLLSTSSGKKDCFRVKCSDHTV